MKKFDKAPPVEADYRLVFCIPNDRYGRMFAFPCDESGKLKPFKSPEQKANHADCVAGKDGMVLVGVQCYGYSHSFAALCRSENKRSF